MADIEIYTKHWCPYCAKAKTLLKSKEPSYREIDITSDTERAEEMVRRSKRRTVPQIFIDGQSIGGYDDLAHLNATGDLDRLLKIETPGEISKIYDVAVIGAGPAGMSAAIYAARKNLSTIVVAFDLGGQMGTTYEISNFPGFQMVTGPDLVQQFSDHADQYRIEKLVGERVTDIELDGRCKLVRTSSGKEIRASSVIIASGAFNLQTHEAGGLPQFGSRSQFFNLAKILEGILTLPIQRA